MEDSTVVKIIDIVSGLSEEQQKGLLEFLTVYYKKLNQS